MSARSEPTGYFIEQWIEVMRGNLEYQSWAPQSYWDAQEPALIEYNSWQFAAHGEGPK